MQPRVPLAPPVRLLTEGLRAPPERLVLIFEAPADERDTGRIEKKLGAPGFVRGFSSMLPPPRPRAKIDVGDEHGHKLAAAQS
jgi:hypothetical protein